MSGISESLEDEAWRIIERSYCYKLLSMIFHPPELRRGLGSIANTLKGGDGELSREAESILRAAESIYSSSGLERIAESMGEMKRLEPLERRLVPGLSVGAVLADISGFYRAFGLRPSDELPIDHLSVEAEFMAQLLLREAYAVVNRNEEMREVVVDAERKFLRDHLGRTVFYVKALRDESPQFDELLLASDAFMDSEFARLGLQRVELDMKIQEAPTDGVRCPYS